MKKKDPAFQKLRIPYNKNMICARIRVLTEQTFMKLELREPVLAWGRCGRIHRQKDTGMFISILIDGIFTPGTQIVCRAVWFGSRIGLPSGHVISLRK